MMRFFSGASPADQLHKLAGRVEVERSHVEQTRTASSEESRASEREEHKTYAIQSGRVVDKDLPFISAAEVEKHTGHDEKQLFIVVNDIVLDVTTYINKHPGGCQFIQGFAGQNCGWQWWRFHNRKVWVDVAQKLRVGRTQGMENKHVAPPTFVGLRPFGYQDD